MSTYTDASLIVTPNAYKEGKLYSLKPTDGAGDLSVTRTTTATRVNEQGLIEDCPYNLTKYSEQSNSWGNQNGVVSTEPIGAFYLDNNKTAIKYTATGVSYNQFYINTENSIIGNQYTLTGYLKSNTVPFYYFDLPSFVNGQRAIYDNINKTIISTPVGVDFQIDELLDNWIYFRISYISQNVSNFLSLKLYSSTASNNLFAGVPIGTEVLATKIQVIKGSVDKPYFKTTDRLNIPRLDYTNASCPSILVEPQRTNLLLRSEEFDNASWLKTNSTVTANATTSPTGNLTADTFNLSNVGQNLYSLFQTGITSSSLTNTFSIYVKYTNRRYIQLVWGSGFSTNNFANFDLISGTITGGTYLDAKINNSYDGFFRISITTTGISTNAIPYIWAIDTFNASRASNSNGIGSYIVFGAQLEAGSNATSYIPTVASTVTRNADVISKSGISDLINSSELTLFIDFDTNITNASSTIDMIILDDGTTSNYVSISIVSNYVYTRTFSGGVFRQILGGPTSPQRFKIAVKIKQNSFKFFRNGIKLEEFTDNNMPTGLNRIKLGEKADAFINTSLIFQNLLTDQECIDLTTL